MRDFLLCSIVLMAAACVHSTPSSDGAVEPSATECLPSALEAKLEGEFVRFVRVGDAVPIELGILEGEHVIASVEVAVVEDSTGGRREPVRKRQTLQATGPCTERLVMAQGLTRGSPDWGGYNPPARAFVTVRVFASRWPIESRWLAPTEMDRLVAERTYEVALP